jgi:hypothetical protein
MSFFDDLREATAREYQVGSEENREAMMDARKAKKLSPDGPRARNMLGAYRTPQAIRAVLGLPLDKDYTKAREDVGIPFDVSSKGKRAGTLLGSLGADLTQDGLRRIYWLLNAAQATGDIISEEVIARNRRDLYALGKPQRTNKIGADGKPIYKRKPKYGGPGAIQAMSIPAGIAINTGLGLMTPFGGAEGYRAVLPSEEDPSKTSNVLGEVAMKYIMGRTGNLLSYPEFSEVRPDVSGDEFGRYKAFKYDKPLFDINPFDDGQTGVFAGALKTTNEGIHGPEVQFLGRSLPLTTGIVPFASAVAGAALGGRDFGPKTGDAAQTPNAIKRQFGSDKPVRRGFIGGMAGLAVGQIAGNIIESERRRRNTVENELDGTLR